MKNVLDFLEDVYKNEILLHRKYGIRIPIEDGFDNSYIGFDVDVDDYNKSKRKMTSAIRLYRHSNNLNNLSNLWAFELGNIIHPICDNKNVPLKFSTYGKTLEESTDEARKHFKKLISEIRKITTSIKLKESENAEEEIEQLKKRLSELQGLKG